jgi:hypothetical protein
MALAFLLFRCSNGFGIDENPSRRISESNPRLIACAIPALHRPSL